MSKRAVYQFPQDFLWGCATAAHQVEGENNNDWTNWEKIPGHVFENQKSGAAVEWWAGRYEEDFDRAAHELHNNAHRLSVEWSRIEPRPGVWDQHALDRYREILKALIARGLKPMVTLHHFTNPTWLAERAAWMWDESPIFFGRFVEKVVAALGDLCSIWCTLNEPMNYIVLGYWGNLWPPGCGDSEAANRAVLNLLRGHANAYHAIKAQQPHSQVGIASQYIVVRPSAPRAINWLPAKFINQMVNVWFARALTDGVAQLTDLKRVHIPQVKNTLDWIGVQYYQVTDLGLNLAQRGTAFMEMRKPLDLEPGPGRWGGLNPDLLEHAIRAVWRLVKKPIYISEWGVPDPDDILRPDHLLRSLKATYRALASGIPVNGFFYWSLLDNFEWVEGRDPRFSFGLYHTDFETQVRTPRRSAHLYGEICARNAISTDLAERYAPALAEHF